MDAVLGDVTMVIISTAPTTIRIEALLSIVCKRPIVMAEPQSDDMLRNTLRVEDWCSNYKSVA